MDAVHRRLNNALCKLVTGSTRAELSALAACRAALGKHMIVRACDIMTGTCGRPKWAEPGTSLSAVVAAIAILSSKDTPY